MKNRCLVGWATLVVVIAAAAILHFTVLCEENECNLPWFVNMLLSNKQLLIYHYRLRSYEEFLTLRTSGGYDQRFNNYKDNPIWALKPNESKADVVKRQFLFREAGPNLCDHLSGASQIVDSPVQGTRVGGWPPGQEPSDG